VAGGNTTPESTHSKRWHLGELSRVACTGHAAQAADTGLPLLQWPARHHPLQACPGPWARRKPP